VDESFLLFLIITFQSANEMVRKYSISVGNFEGLHEPGVHHFAYLLAPLIPSNLFIFLKEFFQVCFHFLYEALFVEFFFVHVDVPDLIFKDLNDIFVLHHPNLSHYSISKFRLMHDSL
jgi:hypothetical protein